jgi:hypothetical protein
MNPPSRPPFFFVQKLGRERERETTTSGSGSPLDPRKRATASASAAAAASRAKQVRRLAPESALERLAASIVVVDPPSGAERELSASPPSTAPAVLLGPSSFLTTALGAVAPAMAVDARVPRVFGQQQHQQHQQHQQRQKGTAAAAAATAAAGRPTFSLGASARAAQQAAPAPPRAPVDVAAIAQLRLPPGAAQAAAVAAIAATASAATAAGAAAPRPQPRPQPRPHLLEAAQRSALERRELRQRQRAGALLDDPEPVRLGADGDDAQYYYSHYDDGCGTCDGAALGIAGSAPVAGSDGMRWEGKGTTTLGARHLGN